MRRLVSCIGLTLLALLVSGWGSMLAAALCPHLGASQPQAVAAEDPPACHAKIEQTNEHHSGSPASEALHGTKIKLPPAPRLHGDNSPAFTQPAGSCTHCVSQNELPAMPAASAQELTLQKRDAGRVVTQTTTIVSLNALFTAQFAPTQHAPPGLTNRKHILLSVFLI